MKHKRLATLAITGDCADSERAFNVALFALQAHKMSKKSSPARKAVVENMIVVLLAHTVWHQLNYQLHHPIGKFFTQCHMTRCP